MKWDIYIHFLLLWFIHVILLVKSHTNQPHIIEEMQHWRMVLPTLQCTIVTSPNDRFKETKEYYLLMPLPITANKGIIRKSLNGPDTNTLLWEFPLLLGWLLRGSTLLHFSFHFFQSFLLHVLLFAIHLIKSTIIAMSLVIRSTNILAKTFA